MAIFNSFFVVFTRELSFPILLTCFGMPLVLAINIPFPGIWCSKLCPLGGLQDEVSVIRKMLPSREARETQRTAMVSAGRRLFLTSGAGLLAALLLPSFIKPARKGYLKPPGSLQADSFNTLCLRCGNCIKSCPTGILRRHMDPNEALSWMVPEIRFIDSYCLEECNTCGQVCPSGAISLFYKKAKSQLFIGFAQIDAANCLLLNNKECDRCKAVCSYDAIAIEPVEGRIIQVQPVVSRETCVGCGACMVICPPQVIEIVPKG
jgi:ferredoxin-type protein NapF